MSLQLTGGRTVYADRETVWAALHDVACLKLCVPGCAALERVSDTRFDLSVIVPVGPVSVVFSGTLEAVDRIRPSSLRLVGRGQGGLAGLAAGHASISLTDVPLGCHLAYRVEAEPSGPLATAGTLLLGGIARAMVDRFATTFAAILGPKDGDTSRRPVRPGRTL